MDLNPKLKKAANGLIQIHQLEDNTKDDVESEQSASAKVAESSLVEPSKNDIDEPVIEDREIEIKIEKPRLKSSSINDVSSRRGNVLDLVREKPTDSRSKSLAELLEEDATVDTARKSDENPK